MTGTNELSERFCFVDTATGGLSHRNTVVRLDSFEPGVSATETYVTWCRYTEDLRTYASAHTNDNGRPSVSGYSGMEWATFVPIDIDVKDDLAVALDQTRTLVRFLAERWEIDGTRIHFSGSKGFALEIPSSVFGGFAPSNDLHVRAGRLVSELVSGSGAFGVDPEMYTSLRLWRVPNTRNAKSGLLKIPLTVYELLTLNIDEITDLAQTPRSLDLPDDDDWEPRAELVSLWEQTASGCVPHESAEQDWRPLDVRSVWAGVDEGSRNRTGWRLASRNRADDVPQNRAEEMQREFAANCRPPLPERIAVDQVERAYRSYEPNPRIIVADRRAVLSLSDWPAPPSEMAYYGLAGEIVRAVRPYTEADPLALLLSFLTGFSALVGPSPHAMVGAVKHSPRLFSVLIGKTGRARKGDSWAPIERIIRMTNPLERLAVQGGLSSGEGLIHAVRDARTERKASTKGGTVEYHEVEADQGVADKRLLVIEPEFARVLETMMRSGNTLNPIIRDAWDTERTLRSMTKTPAVATNPHIAMICHVTPQELRSRLTDTDASNGFGNRFLLGCVQRSAELPNPPAFTDVEARGLAEQLQRPFVFARQRGLIVRDPHATAVWQDMYHDLTRDHPGLAGSMMARAEAHVLRLSLGYALLDCSPVVRVEHLAAAAAVWDYCERTVKYIFGDGTGDPVADRITAHLKKVGSLTRTQVLAVFSDHTPASRIEQAGALLVELGRIRIDHRPTGGRPTEIWIFCETSSANSALTGGAR